MRVVEYTLNEDGSIPDYIVDGGHFPLGDTLIGFAHAAPPEVKTYTRPQLLDRLRAIELSAIEERLLADEEKDDVITLWIKGKAVEWVASPNP